MTLESVITGDVLAVWRLLGALLGTLLLVAGSLWAGAQVTAQARALWRAVRGVHPQLVAAVDDPAVSRRLTIRQIRCWCNWSGYRPFRRRCGPRSCLRFSTRWRRGWIGRWGKPRTHRRSSVRARGGAWASPRWEYGVFLYALHTAQMNHASSHRWNYPLNDSETLRSSCLLIMIKAIVGLFLTAEPRAICLFISPA